MKKYNFRKDQWIQMDSNARVSVTDYDVIYGCPTSGKTTFISSYSRQLFYDMDSAFYEGVNRAGLKEFHKNYFGSPEAKAAWEQMCSLTWNQAFLIQSILPQIHIVTNQIQLIPILKNCYSKRVVGFLREPSVMLEEAVERALQESEAKADQTRRRWREPKHWFRGYENSFRNGFNINRFRGVRGDLFLLEKGEYISSVVPYELEQGTEQRLIKNDTQIRDLLLRKNVPLTKDTFRLKSQGEPE